MQTLNTSNSLITEQFSHISNNITTILDRLERIEKTYVSLNADLITQNIKMAELLNGKLKEPDFDMPDQKTNDQKDEKELYYYFNNENIIVYGPGTYDNRPELRKYGEWNSSLKSWILTISKDDLLLKFPNIIEKEKICNINNE
jgi:hypothetical protein